MIPKTITITHLDAETCVTGSCQQVQLQPEHGGRSIAILVDCGIAQGHDPQVDFDRFPVPPAAIDFLFLTHAHIDHIGWVPDLIDAGFSGEIICTHGTKALKAAGDHPVHAENPGSAIFLLLTKHFSPVMSNNIEHNR
jgi:Cft2 family RNA processing exonuclease